MMTSKQAFIRLLKELGMYKVYCDDVKLAGEYRILDYNDFFSYLIDGSFPWRRTRHETLYRAIYESSCSWYTPSLLLGYDICFETDIKKLKAIVKEYINVINKPESK